MKKSNWYHFLVQKWLKRENCTAFSLSLSEAFCWYLRRSFPPRLSLHFVFLVFGFFFSGRFEGQTVVFFVSSVVLLLSSTCHPFACSINFSTDFSTFRLSHGFYPLRPRSLRKAHTRRVSVSLAIWTSWVEPESTSPSSSRSLKKRGTVSALAKKTIDLHQLACFLFSFDTSRLQNRFHFVLSHLSGLSRTWLHGKWMQNTGRKMPSCCCCFGQYGSSVRQDLNNFVTSSDMEIQPETTIGTRIEHGRLDRVSVNRQWATVPESGPCIGEMEMVDALQIESRKRSIRLSLWRRPPLKRIDRPENIS